eukprot:TRINITY_DN12025_c0_g2_i1.p2 TRINITY_DN12025_c0_g2~~TRINITY_DN12025_c0_g2_i1.p2  ORF type:complete len:212 (-),score=19.53 TRINITY_DN12025_c0_g2_i1:306-941(-)
MKRQALLNVRNPFITFTTDQDEFWVEVSVLGDLASSAQYMLQAVQQGEVLSKKEVQEQGQGQGISIMRSAVCEGVVYILLVREPEEIVSMCEMFVLPEKVLLEIERISAGEGRWLMRSGGDSLADDAQGSFCDQLQKESSLHIVKLMSTALGWSWVRNGTPHVNEQDVVVFLDYCLANKMQVTIDFFCDQVSMQQRTQKTTNWLQRVFQEI